MTHGKPHGWHVITTATTAALYLRHDLIHEATGTTTARAVHALGRYWSALWTKMDRDRWHRAHAPIVEARVHYDTAERNEARLARRRAIYTAAVAECATIQAVADYAGVSRKAATKALRKYKLELRTHEEP